MHTTVPSPRNPSQTRRPQRWYIRCVDCLSVMAVQLSTPPGSTYGVCGACEGKVEVMGRVSRISGRLVVGVEHRSVCDERCTNARGPKCDCPCGGENHGTGLVLEVELCDGKPPRVTPPRSDARERAIEWRAALAGAMASIQPLGYREYLLRCEGAYLSGPEFQSFCRYESARNRVRSVRRLRSHKGRLNALQKLLSDLLPKESLKGT